MTRIYIAGPVTGYPDNNARAFTQATERLGPKYAGHDPVNPLAPGLVDGWEWADYMRRGIGLMLTCQGVAVLEGWQASRGASIEVRLAHDLGLPVAPLERWVQRR